MSAGIVLQARMGSTRLPGKVLAMINGQPILAHCVQRLRTSGLPVIVATTAAPEDDRIADLAAALRAPVVRGATDDVLGRYVQAATTFGLTHVVRATADNPAVDQAAPQRTLARLVRSGAAYVAERGLPVGAAVEALTVEALRLADNEARDPEDREHVTPYLYRERRVAAVHALAPVALRRPDVRLTVDRPDDLARMRDVFALLGDGAGRASLAAIIDAADRVTAATLRQGAVAR
jgi:spore coat polysaccharide biosynthesis protein SpsF